MLTAAVAASVAEEVRLESPGATDGALGGIVVDVVGIVKSVDELAMLTLSFSILFTGGLVEIEVFSGGS
jgi:hypothetical protein